MAVKFNDFLIVSLMRNNVQVEVKHEGDPVQLDESKEEEAPV